MVHVIAIIATRRGHRETVLEMFRANVPAVHAEKGCLQYEAAIDTSPALKFQTDFGPDTFAVIEKWESAQALEAHLATPHMLAYSAKTREFVANRVIHVLSPLGS